MRFSLVSLFLVIVCAACTPSRPASKSVATGVGRVGDAAQGTVSATGRAVRGVGGAVADTTEPVTKPVADAVRPVTKPVAGAVGGVVGGATSIVGSSKMTDTGKAALARPTNCATAKRDIATLEREKASVARQALAGVKSVMPVGAAVSLIEGNYAENVKVSTGEYNAALESKIRTIRATCGVR